MHADRLAKLMGVECLAVFASHGSVNVRGNADEARAKLQGRVAHSDAPQA